MEQRVLMAPSMFAALEWQPVVGFLVGGGMIALGIVSTRGRFRRWEPWYRYSDMPRFLRNGAFALVPFGVAILGLMAAAVTSSNHGVATVGALVFLIAFIVGLVFMIHPPAWVKPRWARASAARDSGGRAC